MELDTLHKMFWIGFAIFEGIFFLRGLYIGLVPSLINLAGLILAVLLGWICGTLGNLILGGFLPWDPYYTGLAIGFTIGFSVYSLVAYSSRLIYEMIDDYLSEVLADPNSNRIKIIYTAGGGISEAAFGLLLLWGGCTIVTATTGVAEAQILKSNLPPNWVERTLIGTRDVIAGAAKGALPKLESLSKDELAKLYQPVVKLVLVSRDPQARARLKKYPDTQNLMLEPKIMALLANPEVNEDVLKKDYVTLSSNPYFLTVASDYGIIRELSKDETTKALDDALAGAPEPAK